MIQLAVEIKFIAIPLNFDWNFGGSMLITRSKKLYPVIEYYYYYWRYDLLPPQSPQDRIIDHFGSVQGGPLASIRIYIFFFRKKKEKEKEKVKVTTWKKVIMSYVIG